MSISFSKYHGAGNDFVMINNYLNQVHFTQNQISKMCDRHLGVGADGLIMIQKKEGYDFEMIYYNSDGFEGTMCGNGGRCAVAFAYSLNLVSDPKNVHFWAVDGVHEAVIDKEYNSSPEKYMRLKLNTIQIYHISEVTCFLNTGSLHHIQWIKDQDLDTYPVVQEGSKIRYSSVYQPQGVNVDFVKVIDQNTIKVRTYERGVEDETMSCGTGATASAIAMILLNPNRQGNQSVKVIMKGGILTVLFNRQNEQITNVWLYGLTCYVFSGLLLI
jgi:diaminopimelate epimerase